MSKKYGDTTLDTKIKRGTNGYFGSRTLNEEKIICGLKEYDKKNIHRYFFFESIVCSNFESCNITKSNFFKNLLLVPIKDIFVEENAFDTFDNIAYSYRQEEVLNNITKLLISDSFQNGLIKDDTWEF